MPPSDPARGPDPTLQLSADEMRALGHRVVDMVVEHVERLRERPVHAAAPRPELERRLREPAPAAGRPWREVLERVTRDVLRPMSHVDHPRFFAYVPSPGNFVSAMADALVAGFNPFAGAWATASGAAQVELVAVDWLREALGMPPSAGGAFVSGGSIANLTALAVARHRVLGGDTAGAVLYCSDQTHSATFRGARVLGFRPEQLRVLPSDGAFRLPLDALARAVAEDQAAGLRPFCVVANGGTVSSGAVDPLPALAELCRARGMWLHVDGAYGGAAVLAEAGRAALAGIGEADSVAIDPHKWLFQPYEAGCVLVRDGRALPDAFREVPAYLRDSDLAAEEVNFRDRGVQLTRSFRALKVWMSIQVFGMDAFRAAVARGIRLAEVAEAALREAPGAWEVTTPAQLAVVTFRHRGGGDGLQRRLAAALLAGGWAMISTTELRGRAVLRLCTINPRTTDDEVRETVRRLAGLAAGTAP